MAPKKPDSCFQLLAALARFLLVDQAGGEIGVDRHLLAGHGVQVKRAATSAMRPEPLVMTTKFTITRIAKTMMPMTKLPLITNLPNAWMTWPAAAGALVAVRQDQAGRGEIERQPQHGGDQQHGREGGEFERRLDEQRRHQDQHRRR